MVFFIKIKGCHTTMSNSEQQSILYGIKNCSTIRKARDWLDAQGIDYQFHDYKSQGIETAKLSQWCQQFGWQKILNRAGTTFRRLTDADKTDLDQDKAIALMQRQPSMIKRPILELANGTLVGFSPESYAAAFAGNGEAQHPSS